MTTELLKLGRGVELSDALAKAMNLPDPESDPMDKTMLELFVNNMAFASENQFSPEAASTFFSIMKSTLDTSMVELMAVDKSYNLFKAVLLRHSVQRPPYSVGVFTLAEIKAVNDYVINGFFRHYKLYRYVFTKEQRHTIGTQAWLGELPEFAPLPPPLSLAEEQLAEQPVELAEDAVQEIVEQTGEDPLSIKEAFAAAVKAELRGLQASLQAQEETMTTMVTELEAKIEAAVKEQELAAAAEAATG